MINGPEAFTPDNEFCLGETEVAGFFVAAGFCAHGIAGAGGVGKVVAEWIVEGEPGLDVWHMDINRFGAQWRSPGFTVARTIESYQRYYDIPYPGLQRSAGRPLRTSPAYDWHREHDAEFGEKAGWERVDYYNSNARDGDEGLRPQSWAGRHWSAAIGVEHLATRATAGIFDETSFAKLEVSGPDAADFLEWVCDNRVARSIGAVTYTQALNRRGGIEADFTVTRTADDVFLVITGTAFGTHDASWLRKQATRRQARIRISDVTGLYACYAVWGPRSRDILGRLTDADFSESAFPFMTSQLVSVADAPVRALRVTFVGELGWELYTPSEYGAGLWRRLWEAGADLGLVAGGYRAIESMRLEKGYRVWGTDITPETSPYEAGLGFCVKLDKPGGFEGRDALLAAKDAGLRRRMCAIVLDDPGRVVIGNEPVRVGGRVSGRVTSGGYGYTVKQSIAYTYLDIGNDAAGTPVEIDLFGEWVGGAVVAEPVLASGGNT
jgi:4-methylaminobutanoate oxidase (formaldehyde-forming)